jgi:hypothetical protein
MTLRRDLPGSKVPKPVLPTNMKSILPDQNGCRKGKTKQQKHFAPRHGLAQMRRSLSNETPAIHTYVKFCIYGDDI